MTASVLCPGLQTVPEIPTAISLPVTGTLPPYLHTSTLYRNGPGRFDLSHADGKPQAITHWFDGYSLLHAFAIHAETNTVTYRSRFTSLPSQRAAAALPKSKYVQYTFGPADPCRSLLGKFMQLWTTDSADPLTDKPATNINVTVQSVPTKGPVILRTDANVNAVVDPDTLELHQFFSFTDINPALKGPFSSAHGHFDHDKHEFLNFTFDMTGPGDVTYNVFSVDKVGSADVLASIRAPPAYLHSFATTENYLVLIVWPLHIHPLKFLWNKSFMDGMRFHKDKPARFFVVSRAQKRFVAEYNAPAFYCFHTINAFERDDAIHIDLCKYDDAEVLNDFLLDHLRNASRFSPSSVVRFSLPHLAAALAGDVATVHPVTETLLNGSSLELPRIHPSLLRKDYRFVYGVSNRDGDTSPFGAVAKVDVVSGERKVWTKDNCVAGEPIFVPDPQGTREDDGVLLVVVLDSLKETSALVVLDAHQMTEVATATVPQAVPLGFHGKFHPNGH
ncbi:unnamed protein product [Chondrus crispus]|uniref:Carotenoid oxygenase n=1 Tax=Chondrus crispus TaxID=2769 RepID=R7QGU2_CHOCR|nr:unnamed protein product [Chondrus crispus]CDF36963.1 unnamed protein product [Chondrus crispus]|eukprot:XP_005716782.1 unnamed protein product [Chondrus crispus]